METFQYNLMNSDNWCRESLDDTQVDKKTVISSSNNRIFYLYGDIDARNCADIAYEISCINIIDDENEEKQKNYVRKPIKIYFSSHGGSIFDMWLLVDTILGSKTQVYTYCTGYAMSAAFIVFLAGDKRYMSPHASIMFHQISCWRSGKYQDIVDDREHMDELNDEIERFVLERSNLDKETIIEARKKKRDMYFSVKDALKYGIIDEVLFSKSKEIKHKEDKKKEGK